MERPDPTVLDEALSSHFAAFDRALVDAVRRVPPGWVVTYGELAEALGDRRAARAVADRIRAGVLGDALAHRVVDNGGDAGADPLGRLRGVGINPCDRGVSANAHRFLGVASGAPLTRCRTLQELLAEAVVTEDVGPWSTVGGADVSCRGDLAFGACVVMDPDGRVIDEAIATAPVGLPYVPTYLGFREAPAIVKAVRRLRRPPSLLMVDGNGILHPRRFGSACHVGLALGVPTVGVAKRLTCGTVDAGPPVARVLWDGRHVGWAVWSGRSQRPVFVSPGHFVSVETALDVVQRFCRHRIPEPIRRADSLCRLAAKAEGIEGTSEEAPGA